MSKCWVSPTLMLCITVLLARLGCPPGVVVGDAGSDFLDRKELEVAQIADLASLNFGQQCALLATCGNPTNCSRDSCSPLLEDRNIAGSLQCTDVNNNKYCTNSGSGNTTSCKQMLLDYRRSHVRVSTSTNLKSEETLLAICSQRALEPLFKTLSVPPVLTRVYFAPVDGTWRVFPGLVDSADYCRKFDPRVRPWYRTATSVVKVVVVLIDLGASMSDNLPPSLGAGTILEAAKHITLKLLTTLSVQDHVNIILFDSSRVIRLSPTAVLVQDHNSTVAPELDPLKAELDKYTVAGQFQQSNLSAAIEAAMPNFDSNPVAAKVIVVISDFATPGNVTLPTAALSRSAVKLFLYKLPRSSDKDPYLLASNDLLQQLCSVGGHFEVIMKNLDNPLLGLHRFFSHLANLKRIATNGRPQYTAVYQDFDQIGGNIITVTKLAFSGEDLVGVAGITIYIEALGNLTAQVKRALLGRVTGYVSPAPTGLVLTSANCSLVNETAPPCGGTNAYYDPNGGLCPKTDFQSTIEDLACCGTCSAALGPGDDGRGGPHRLPGKAIAGIVAGSVVGLLVVVVAGWLAIFVYPNVQRERRRRKEEWRRKLNAPPPLGEEGELRETGQAPPQEDRNIEMAIRPASSTSRVQST